MLKIFLTGLAMGAADVVPGVSGGTIAFISGIYLRLLNAIRSVNPTAFKLLFNSGGISAGVAAVWKHIDGLFLLVLGGGIGISVLSLSKAITYLLATYPVCVWGFFFGLIAASSLYLARQISWGLLPAVMLFIGIGGALFVGTLRPSDIEATPLVIFLSGAVAICAMILPGISGSFILLIIGMYPRVLAALTNLDLGFIIIFALGCGTGLLCFSHVLGYLLSRFKDTMLALLTGFLMGSLVMVWPWQWATETVTKSDGRIVTLQKINVLPELFAELTQQEPYTAVVMGLGVLGVILVFAISKLGPEKA